MFYIKQVSARKAKEDIMVKINGTEFDISGKTVSEYLETTNYDLKRIAVER